MLVFRIYTACFIACLLTYNSPVTANSDLWQYGATIDLSYANAFQSDDPVLWRSKATTQRLNEFAPNMGMLYLRKLAEEN